MKILIVGYYDKCNLGDELFKESFKLLFPSHELYICNIDDIPRTTYFDLLIFGGGDLMNEYFIGKLKRLNRPEKKIGLGIGFLDVNVRADYVNLFSCICTRTRNMKLLKNLVNSISFRRVMCIPDLVFSLSVEPVSLSKGVLLIPSLDRISELPQIYDYICVFDELKDKVLSDNIIRTMDEFRNQISLVDKVVTYKFHGLVLSLMYKRFVVCDKRSFKCRDLLTSVFGDKYSQNLMFDSSSPSLKEDILRCLEYVETHRKVLMQKIEEYLNYTKLYYSEWSEEYMLGIFKVLDVPTDGTDYNKLDIQSLEVLMFDLKLGSNSCYRWGIEQSKNSLSDQYKWIYSDKHTKNIITKPFNTSNYNQDFHKSVHRYGWNYVTSNLESICSPTGILLDTYLDSSWNSRPHLCPWYGIVHHPDGIPSSYSESSMSRLFKSKFWQLSKPYCQGLISLSSYLSRQLETYVEKKLIHTTFHPMSQLLNQWNLNEWLLNGKRVLSVGNWLRDEYILYELNYNSKYKIYNSRIIPPQKIYAYNMIPDKDYILDSGSLGSGSLGSGSLGSGSLGSGSLGSGSLGSGSLGSGSSNNNLWLYFANKYYSRSNIYLSQVEIPNHDRNLKIEKEVQKKINSVVILPHQTNKEYDELLSSSVVLLYLIDSSASNTLLECIMSNTPVYINRTEASIEYLGVDYPLYYNDIKEVKINVIDIKKAYKYLKNLDKNRFSIDYFLNSLLEIYNNKK